MSRSYSGRHRPVTESDSGRSDSGRRHHRAEPRRRTTRDLAKPLSVSAVSIGAMLAVVQTASSASLTDLTQSVSLPRPSSLISADQHVEAAPAAAPKEAAQPTASPTAAPTSAPPTETPPATPEPTTTTTTATPSVDTSKMWILPVKGAQFTSGFGRRWGTVHKGIDLAAPIGTPLYAMSGGKVIFAGQMQGYGKIVQIRYWDGTVSYYGHMNAISVSVGQAVVPGQVVGQLGNTGQSTGPHLHLEIHPAGGAAIDPLTWLKNKGIAVR